VTGDASTLEDVLRALQRAALAQYADSRVRAPDFERALEITAQALSRVIAYPVDPLGRGPER
jgi:hypothetical protein